MVVGHWPRCSQRCRERNKCQKAVTSQKLYIVAWEWLCTACIPFKYSKLELLRNTYVHATCYSSSPTPSYDACHAPTVRELIFRLIHYIQTTENIWFWYLGHLKGKGSLGWFLEMCTSIHQIILSIPGKECLLNWHCLLHHLKFDITRSEIFSHIKYSYGSTI